MRTCSFKTLVYRRGMSSSTAKASTGMSAKRSTGLSRVTRMSFTSWMPAMFSLFHLLNGALEDRQVVLKDGSHECVVDRIVRLDQPVPECMILSASVMG